MSKIVKIRNGESFVNKLTNGQDNKISYYEIITTNKSHVFTREQLELLYRFYSTNKNTLSTSEICSRFFPYLTVKELRNIIRTLSLEDTLDRNNTSYTPHEYEELTEEERKDKISNFILHRQIVLSQSTEVETLKQLVKKQQDIISKYVQLKQILKSTKNFNQKLAYYKANSDSKKSLALYISDMHIGCRVDAPTATLNENINYDIEEVYTRIDKVIEHIKTLGTFDEIWVFNLGDAIDGVDATTTRRDVNLPQNMSNNEMINNYISIMIYLVSSLAANNLANKYYFRSVGESNHGGTAEYAASLAIGYYLSSRGVDVHISDSHFGCCKIQDSAVIYLHGKDNTMQNKPLPNILDNKTVVYLNSFIDTNGLTSYEGPILFVKGDSHNPALTSTDNFEYKTVGSLFGGSGWAQSNFPKKRWEVNYSIFEGSNRLDGSIKDNIKYDSPKFI